MCTRATPTSSVERGLDNPPWSGEHVPGVGQRAAFGTAGDALAACGNARLALLCVAPAPSGPRHHSAPTPACSTAPRLCDGESSARDQRHLLSCVPACVARKPLAAADRASALAGMRGGSPLHPPRRCEQISHRLPLLIVKGNSTSQTFVCRELAHHLPANEARLRKQRRRRQVVCLLGRRRPGRRQPGCLRVPHLPRAGLEPPQVVFVLVAGDSALSRGSFL